MTTHGRIGTSLGQAAGANPFVFVVGCPRSGTTLLQRMLDNHPMLAVANDTHFIPWAVAGGGLVNPPMSPELAQRVAGYRRFYRFGLPEASVAAAADGAATYSAFVAGLYDEFAHLNGKPLAGEKTPDYVLHIPLLHELFPAAKCVHITRDGRDVALSIRKWAVKDRPPDETGSTLRGPARHPLWAQEPFGAIALFWAEQVLAGAAAGDALGPSLYHHLCYEDLVADPEAALARIAAFLGLPDAPEMAAYHVGKERQQDKDLSAKKAWLRPTAGLRDWRAQMEATDAALFEALAKDALERFGYPFETAGENVTERAALCRLVWAQDRPRQAAALQRTEIA